MKTFPTLYQKNNNGKLQQWTVAAEYHIAGGLIRTTWGQVGGQLQETNDIITEGKNLGRSNQTNALQQTLLEAESKWRKKIEREGYVEDIARAEAGETDQAGGIQPMLAKPLDDINAKYLKWPAAWQRKFNGNRGIAMVDSTSTQLWSRKQKLITGVPHITAALNRVFASGRGDTPPGLILDGEVYRHGWSLQKISGFFRKEGTTKPGYEELSYNVYDVPSHPGTWAERQAYLDDLFRRFIWPRLDGLNSEPIRLVQTREVKDLDQAWTFSKEAVQVGYEGGILRQLAGKYEAGKRSPYLGKLKSFIDDEAEILAITEGRGKFAGKAMFSCRAKNGAIFDCCAPGTMEDRAEFFRLGDKLVGEQLTYRYFELSEDGVPLFPTGVAVRNYE